MNINIKNKDNITIISLEGKLDTNTSPLLETKFSELENVTKMELDLVANSKKEKWMVLV